MSGRDSGQASVELVAILPLVVVVALAVAQLLAAGAATELAGHAAEAGAVAVLEGGDGVAAARRSVPGWSARHMRVRVRGRHVEVRLRPVAVVPGMAALLEAHGRADAGPAS